MKNIGQGIQQSQAVTGQALPEQAHSGLFNAALDIGAQQASADVKRRRELIERGKQNEIQTRMAQLQEQGLKQQEYYQKKQLRKMDDQGGGGCCFIFIESYGSLLPIVRRYRDEHMTTRNRRGYYRMADRIVPLMRRSRVFKWVVRILMTDPMVSYGKYFYGQGKVGVIFKPVTKFWLKVFDLMGWPTARP